MPLFPENVLNFGFLQMTWNAISVHIFKYKNARKTSYKKYYTIGLFQLLQRQICEGNR